MPKPNRRSLVLALALACPALLGGCEEKKPVRMELRPAGPIEFEDLGTVRTVHMAFFTEDGKPYVRKPTAVFDAEDPSVVTVKAGKDDATATLEAKKSGETTVTVRAFGLEESIDVKSSILGSIEIDPKTPDTLRVNGRPITLKYTIKDDRGNVMEGVKARVSASDYCVDVSPGAKIKGVAVGECDVVVQAGGQSARHTFKVR